MSYAKASTYCSECFGPYVVMDDGRCGACTLTDPPIPPAGSWARGHEDANDEVARAFKAAWERFHRESQARLAAKEARAAADAEWAATGEAGVRARWN